MCVAKRSAYNIYSLLEWSIQSAGQMGVEEAAEEKPQTGLSLDIRQRGGSLTWGGLSAIYGYSEKLDLQVLEYAKQTLLDGTPLLGSPLLLLP